MAPAGTPYGFTRELTDGNGLVYLRARYLAPDAVNFLGITYETTMR